MSDSTTPFGSFITQADGATVGGPVPFATPGAVSEEKALSSGEAATLGRIGSLLDGVIADEAGEPTEADGDPSLDPRLTEARSLTQALINSSSY